MALDVLDDDDRVVDDASDGHGQRAQGEDVERVPADEQADHRNEEGQRNRDAGDEGRRERAQEEQDDEHGHQQADPALHAQVMNRLLNEGSLVEDGIELGAVPEPLLQQLEFVHDGV